MADRRDQTDATLAAKAFLTLAHDQWRASSIEAKPNRDQAQEALDFLALKQWDDDVRKEREGLTGHDKPVLTMDQIGEPFRQLIGRQRQADPSIQILPAGEGADQDTAEIFQGLIRHYAVTGHAKDARDEAFKNAAGAGWGYYALLVEDAAPGSFQQTITYRAIENIFTVYDDPDAKGPLKRDRRYLYITQMLPKAEFQRLYPKAKYSSAGDLFAAGQTNETPDWYTDGGAMVAERWYLDEEVTDRVSLLSDGRELPEADARAIVSASQSMAQPSPGAVLNLQTAPAALEIVRTKDVKTPVVKWAKISGAEILDGNNGDDPTLNTEGRRWPGSMIPFIRVVGERLVKDGKELLWGLPRPMIGPQQLYNFTASEFASELSSGPRTKIIAPEGSNEGHEIAWENPDRKNLTALFYKPVMVEGTNIPAPAPTLAQFTDSAKLIALLSALNQYKSDLKSASGYYDSSDPSRKNTEQSAKALLARKEESQQSSANYVENYTASLTLEGEMQVDLIPKIVRKGDVLRILDMEDQPSQVLVGQPFTTGDNGQPMALQPGEPFQKGLHQFFDPSVGTYDVTVTVGASYPTRRKEAFDTWMQLIQSYPALMGIIGDLVIDEMDAPGAPAIAKRLKKALPPNLADDQDSPIPPQVVAKVKQMQQQAGQVIQVLTEHVQKLEEEKAAKAQELDAKLAIARMDNETKLRVAEASAKNELGMQRAELMAQRLEQLLEHAHEVGILAETHANQRAQAQQQAGQQAALAEQGQQHALESQQQAAELQPQPEAGA